MGFKIGLCVHEQYFISIQEMFILQQNRIHPFSDGRRSKSIEEREEEYQRVRERIFAPDVSNFSASLEPHLHRGCQVMFGFIDLN